MVALGEMPPSEIFSATASGLYADGLTCSASFAEALGKVANGEMSRHVPACGSSRSRWWTIEYQDWFISRLLSCTYDSALAHQRSVTSCDLGTPASSDEFLPATLFRILEEGNDATHKERSDIANRAGFPTFDALVKHVGAKVLPAGTPPTR